MKAIQVLDIMLLLYWSSFIKIQYYWKALKKVIKDFVRHCLQCQPMNLQVPNYIEIHLEITKMPTDFIAVDPIDPLKLTIKTNQ